MSKVKVPKNILELSKEEKRQFIESFDLVLHDCDGVLWTLTGGLPGIKEGIEVLYKLKKNIGFVTNNSVTSRERFEKKFESIGVNLDYDTQLIHPATSFVTYLKKIKFDKTVFLIGSSPHRKCFDDNGIKYIVARDQHDSEEPGPFYKEIFADIDRKSIGAVAFEVDFNFNVAKFYLADYFLRDPDCLLLIGGTDAAYYMFDHWFPGNKMFIDNLLARVKQDPIGLGKPGNKLGEIIMEKFEIKDPSKVLFVGDTLEQDIGFAKSNGFQTLLVLTGVTSEEMLEHHEVEEEIPDYYAKGMFDFVEFYEDFKEEE